MIWSDNEILHEERDFAVSINYCYTHPSVPVPFMHLDVTNWSPSALRAMCSVWSRLRPSLPPVLFAQATIDDARISKLAKYFGFQFHGDCPCDDGTMRRLFVNYRK